MHWARTVVSSSTPSRRRFLRAIGLLCLFSGIVALSPLGPAIPVPFANRLPAATPAARAKGLAPTFGKLPLGFEANQGQTDRAVKFLLRGRGYALFLTADEAALTNDIQRTTDSVLRMRLVGANASLAVTGADELPGRSNYLIGNDPQKWRTNVPNYAKVKYQNVYPGVDLVYYGNQRGQLEYDFVVAPGADERAIKLQVGAGFVPARDGQPRGVPLRIAANGDLVVKTGEGEVRFHKPVVYQPAIHSGQRTADCGQPTPIEGHYVLQAGNQVGFQVASYDRTRPLVIDPVLFYSTYFGGAGADQALAVAVDSQGDFYVTGQTASSSFPLAGAFQGTYGGITDAFVAKFKGDGSGLVYSTYLGGSFPDIAQAIAVDSQGNAYVTGFTTSSDFPTKNPLQAALSGMFNQDLFITKLSPDGSSLVYSTYLGGTGLDTIAGIALDAQNEVVLAGTTKSTDFPVVNALEPHLTGTSGNSDAFVAKIQADGSALVFSTYLGGTGVDGATGVAVDSEGNIVVSGGTNSTDFPTLNAVQSDFGGGTTTNVISADGFLTKLKGDGSALLFSTYWGGSNSDQAAYLSLDNSDNIFLVGETNSDDFPTSNQTKPPGAGITGFVTKFKPDGSSALFSTIFGGSGTDFIYGSAVDPDGNIYVSGNTNSADFPLTNPLQSTYGGGTSDGFVSELSGDGSALLFSTYLGGSNTDGFDRMAADGNGIYIVGSSSSTDFPTAGDPLHISQYVGGGDGVVVKITTGGQGGQVSFSTSSLAFADQMVGTTSASQPVTLTNATSATLNITDVSISPDYGQSNNCGTSLAAGANCTFNVTFTPTATGLRPGTLTVTDDASGSPQTVSLTGTGTAPVVSLSSPSLIFPAQIIGTSSVQTVTLTNMGTASLNISGMTASGDFSQSNTCGTTLGAGANCTISVTFKPLGTGTSTGTLSLSDDATGSPQAVALSGTGVVFTSGPHPPVVPPRPPSPVPGQPPRAPTVPPPAPVGGIGTEPIVRPPGVTVLPIQPPPVSVFGQPAYNASNSPQTVTSSGSGTAPRVSFSAANLGFGNQALNTASAVQTETVTNTGTTNLVISTVTLSGTNSSYFAKSADNCSGTTLSPNSTCTVSVTFTPSSTGSHSASLIFSQQGSNNPQTVTLSGTSADPVVRRTDPPVLSPRPPSLPVPAQARL